MRRFNSKGMLVFPTPDKKVAIRQKRVWIVEEVYCQNGHSLIGDRAVFNNYKGIYLKVKGNNKEGWIALSPFCGDKSWIACEVDLENGEILEFFCPECGVKLPIYRRCACGAHLFTMFTDKNADFRNCIGICNRIGCQVSEIVQADELRCKSCLDAKK